MTRSEFLEALQDMMQCDDPLAETTQLKELEEWDSLAFMVLISFFDKTWGKRIVFEDLTACETPTDVMALAAEGID